MKKLLTFAFAAFMAAPLFAGEAELQEQVKKLQAQLQELQNRVEANESSTSRLMNEWVVSPQPAVS
jgi:cell division protein FtsB